MIRLLCIFCVVWPVRIWWYHRGSVMYFGTIVFLSVTLMPDLHCKLPVTNWPSQKMYAEEYRECMTTTAHALQILPVLSSTVISMTWFCLYVKTLWSTQKYTMAHRRSLCLSLMPSGQATLMGSRRVLMTATKIINICTHRTMVAEVVTAFRAFGTINCIIYTTDILKMHHIVCCCMIPQNLNWHQVHDLYNCYICVAVWQLNSLTYTTCNFRYNVKTCANMWRVCEDYFIFSANGSLVLNRFQTHSLSVFAHNNESLLPTGVPG